MTRFVDLNADLGEGFPWDQELIGIVTSTSISCGAHAGTPEQIQATISMAVEAGVAIGAHPGYADLEGFGRRNQTMNRVSTRDLVLRQSELLGTWIERAGGSLLFLKPHGALYNQAQREVEIGDGVLDACVELGLPLLCQPGSRLSMQAKARKQRFVAEGFPDRRYLPDGSLAPRSAPDSSLYDAELVRANVLWLLNSGIETLCVHGDDERAPGQARLLRRLLEESQCTPRSFAS